MGLESPWSTVNNRYFIHSDAVARRSADTIFVVNRFLSDNILVLNAAANYAVIDQYSTGLNSNPYDIEVVAPGRAYIPRYEETSLWVVEPLHGGLLNSVDLAIFADADGIPEMSQVAAVGTRAFVTIQRLDRLQAYLPPAGGSSIAVIDINSDQIVDANPLTAPLDAIALPVENPTGDLWYDRSVNRLLVVCSGEFLVNDGGLVVVNPFTLQSEGLMSSEAQLGGDLQAARLTNAQVGWAIISDSSFRTSLVRFDVTTGDLIQNVYTSAGFDLSDLEISSSGKLYLSDRTPQNPGVRIYDAFTGASLGGPIATGLPPFDLVLRDDAPEGPITQAPARRVLELNAWPNPFNPRVSLELRGAQTQAVLEVVDARGRRLRRLAPRSGEDGVLLYEWDGTDSGGQAVSSGSYWASVVGEAHGAISLSLVR